MTNRNKPNQPIDPIPDEFASYEEAAEFWDSHDTTEYLDSFETVPMEVELTARHYEVEVDEDVLVRLREQAKIQGIPLKQLVSELLRKQLPAA